ncbi:MAG TPA: thiamine pyrophosphate-binding protein [Actinomycetota bacterium]|nr:thiamine pyrophosphate-binding protein [Actinomycetota bacterium]
MSPVAPADPAGFSQSIGGVAAVDRDFSSSLVSGLSFLGVEWAFGVPGGGIARIWRALIEGIGQVCFSHEQGAVFAAIEAGVAGNRPVAVFCTTGPGLTNTLSGLVASRHEGAKIILISARTSPSQTGTCAIQETPAMVPSADFFSPGWLFDDVFLLDLPEQLGSCLHRLSRRLQAPGGYLAHLSIPVSVQNLPVPEFAVRPRATAYPPAVDNSAVAEAAALLRGRRFVVWAGHGARSGSRQVREFIERTGAPVLTTARGKGVVSDHDPRLLMVTGMGGHPEARRWLSEYRPEVCLVLGTRMGEASGGWDPSLTPSAGFIQVDLNPAADGPRARHLMTIQGDVGSFLEQLTPLMPAAAGPVDYGSPYPGTLEARCGGGVRPQYLIGAMERVLTRSGCPILVEPGSCMAWAIHWLRAPEPGLLRIPSQFGCMGHMTCGVVGAALAGGRPAACLTGDGSMLMAEEVHTAADRGVPAIWVVLNNGGLQMVEAGMSANGPFGSEARFLRCDFTKLAEAWGATGIAVAEECEADGALTAALASGGPCIVDVQVDLRERAPIGERLETLARQQIGA